MSLCKRSIQVAALALVLSNLNFTDSTQARFPDKSGMNGALVPRVPEPLPLPPVGKLTKLQKAYLDSYSILSQNNSCSAFFGGPAVIRALNDFTPTVAVD